MRESNDKFAPAQPASNRKVSLGITSPGLASLLLLLAALCGTAILHGQDKPEAQTPAPAVKPPIEAPDVPALKQHEGSMKMHERFLSIARKGEAQLLFIGDSITMGWSKYTELWNKAFGAYQPANFGIGGDRTQHVLWRITNGELDGIKPKTVVLMIGTNNSSADTADGIARGITKIVETIREKLPGAKVLLLAVFPRDEKPTPRREKIKQVNATIAKLDDGKSIFFLDIGDKFLEPDGTLSKEVMYDHLHLTLKGYQIWASAITPKLAELMK